MKSGTWKKLCLNIACVGVALCTPASLFAQDNFREFNRRMVVTPAQLYDVLSSLHPDRQRKQIDPQGKKDIEKAGLDLLSQLSPEKQDQIWDLAEKHLRKNGVDSASARNLMQEFGLPPERQNELLKQFRKFAQNQSNGSGEGEDGISGDAIRQLVQKARDEFRRANVQDGASTKAKPSDRTAPGAGTEDAGSDRQGAKQSQLIPGQAEGQTEGQSEGQSNSTGAGTPGQRAIEAGDSRTGDGRPSDPRFKQSPDGRTEGRTEGGTEGRTEGRTEGGTDGQTVRQPDADGRANPTVSKNRARGTNNNSDPDLDKLIEQLKEQKDLIETARKLNGENTTGEDSESESGIDWKKVIDDLAEKEDKGFAGDLSRALKNRSSREQSQAGKAGASNDQANKSMLERAREFFSGTTDAEEESQGDPFADGTGGSPNEKVGTRFDRLLVKAVDRTLDRTLDPQRDQGVSNGVSGALGKLMERFKDKDSDDSDQGRRSGRGGGSDGSSGGGSRRDGSSADRNSNDGGADQLARNDDGRADRGSNILGDSSQSQSLNANSSSAFNPRSLLDSLPDPSSINPSHVFTFFAIAGVILFVGYLLTQSIAGDESAAKKRAVIKQVRKTSIKTPKDLVETVDMFLLAKFGIKSSWWNAKLAQRVLDSGSSELQSQVDDLFRDYVRARYMRSDVQIPDADQQRYRQTLEQLSKLDFKPESAFGPGKVSVKEAPHSPARQDDGMNSVSLEG